MQKNTNFSTVNENAAGIDIGAEKIFVSVDGSTVENFNTFTQDYRKCITYLKSHGIQQVAMEATGVYWMSLYDMLEAEGLNVCLVNPREIKQVKGRKSDVRDCQWIQRLHSAGLLRESFIPKGMIKELRMLVREREDVIAMGGSYVNKMQKAMELMNIKLGGVLSQIHGASGIRIIEAIIAGERDSSKLIELCEKRVITQKTELLQAALEGNYNPTYVFMLESNLRLWKIHQEELARIDGKIDAILTCLNQGKPTFISADKPKNIRHHKPQVTELNQKMLDAFQVNVSSLSGLNDYSLLRLLGETGNTLEQFPTSKHFVSWCQLCPKHSQSGRSKRRVRTKNKSKAGQIFRDAARGLLNSNKIAIGAFMRKIRSKKGAGIAIKAGARKLAEAYYNIITKGTAYVEEGIEKYEQKMKERELVLIVKLAQKHQLTVFRE
jgi:transposase